MPYRAFVVDKQDDTFTAAPQTLPDDHLPDGDVTVAVDWSDLNYKDALASTPTGRVVRSYPMVPGIDFAGTVVESSDPRFPPGRAVLATGFDLGVAHPGGYAERVRVPGDWLVPLPDGLTTEEAMIYGTAGFTAALSVEALEQRGVTPAAGPVLVTGATGGVGSVAVAMLARLGYTVAASTGKADQHDYLRALGASEILDRAELAAESRRPLESERWAGAVDPVGGSTTATILRTARYGGVVALSGLTGGVEIKTTVMPFILRRVQLVGIDSVALPAGRRLVLWQRMAGELKPPGLLDIVEDRIGLDELSAAVEKILRGGVRGRILVRPA